MSSLIAPHGGILVDRRVAGESAVELRDRAASLPSLVLNDRQGSDFEMIATGGLSPLTGFMDQETYRSVLSTLHLPGGRLAWTIPIVLAPDDAATDGVQVGQEVALYYEDGKTLAGTMEIQEIFPLEKEREAHRVYRTTDEKHPGVEAVYQQGSRAIAGDILAVALPPYSDFPDERLTPAQTRAAFAERGWASVVAFQTRNPIHRAHEYIIRCAMEIVDGLLLHPLVGATKGDDIRPDVRMECYRVLLDNYFPADRVLLAVNPAAMRYAGPSEAIFHALVRKNYGCTHFIVGRDHAGVGNYYGTYDAQKIFDDFDRAAIDILPLKFEHSFWSTRDGGMATSKTSKATPEERISLSGTRVREMLRAGEIPPVEFTRPEVAEILIRSMRDAS
ncbi:MAG: sulfate adenylyltransferase [Armatimonadetes bacterium]|nr:sulfate adenylyltransferase [Armatimonadota bacterium]